MHALAVLDEALRLGRGVRRGEARHARTLELNRRDGRQTDLCERLEVPRVILARVVTRELGTSDLEIRASQKESDVSDFELWRPVGELGRGPKLIRERRAALLELTCTHS